MLHLFNVRSLCVCFDTNSRPMDPPKLPSTANFLEIVCKGFQFEIYSVSYLSQWDMRMIVVKDLYPYYNFFMGLFGSL